MLKIDLQGLLFETRKSIPEMSKEMGIPENSLRLINRRGTAKPWFIVALESKYSKKTVSKFIKKK